MIIYGVAAETSIGNLFLGGLLPGLLMAGALMLMVSVLSKRRNMPAVPAPGGREIWQAFTGAIPA